MKVGFLSILWLVAVALPLRAGEQAKAVAAVVGGFVSGISVVSQGSGYITEPGVALVGGGGSGAAAKAILGGDKVVGVVVLSAGSGYSSAPIVTIDPPPSPPARVELVSELVPKLTLRGQNKTMSRVERAPGISGPWSFWTNVYVGDNGVAMVDLLPQTTSRYYRAISLFRVAHENSLGMIFVPVAGTGVHFSVWETRVADFADYAHEAGLGLAWRDEVYQDLPVTPTHAHPVVNIGWGHARAFCEWLTAKERREGRLTANQRYRLPTDAEWSWAVGIGHLETGSTPQEKSGKLPGVYPWGSGATPLQNVGNYFGAFPGSLDTYPRASPVGSFPPNPAGLFDMGGNVWEFCEDVIGSARVVRGGSWMDSWLSILLSSIRSGGMIGSGSRNIGFRCVLEGLDIP